MRVILVLALTMVALTGCGKKKGPKPSASDSPPAVERNDATIIPGGVVVNPGEVLSGGGGGGGGGGPPPSRHVTAVSGAGGVVASNQSGNLTVNGGQGGAIQAPRMAAARLANKVQLDQLYKSMSVSWLVDQRVPSLNEVLVEARQNPQLFPLIKEEVVILTGTTRGDGVWAYTQYPQQMNEHFVVTQQGVVQMSTDDLRKRLEQQQSPVKLAK